MSSENAGPFKHWRFICWVSTMPSSRNRGFSQWPAHFLCRRANWKMAAGCIRRDCLWAADGAASAVHPATKARNQAIRKCTSSAIWVTRRVASDCRRTGLTTQYDFRLLATRVIGCRFGSYASPHIVRRGTERCNTISRSASGRRRIPTRAFRKWQTVICNPTYCAGQSLLLLPVRAELHEHNSRSKRHEQQPHRAER